MKTYIQAMRDAKNMEYVSKIYRKNLLEVWYSQSLMYEQHYDMGKFSLTLKYIMNFIRDGGNGSTTDSDSDHFRSLTNKIGSTGYGRKF